MDGKGNVDEEATSSYQDAMVNTIQYGAPVVAEDVLLEAIKRLKGMMRSGRPLSKPRLAIKSFLSQKKDSRTLRLRLLLLSKTVTVRLSPAAVAPLPPPMKLLSMTNLARFRKLWRTVLRKIRPRPTKWLSWTTWLFSDGPERAVEDAGCPVRGWWNLLCPACRGFTV